MAFVMFASAWSRFLRQSKTADLSKPHRSAAHTLGVGLFPVRFRLRQNAVVIEVDQSMLQTRLSQNRQGDRRGDPVVGIVVIAIGAVGDAALEPALDVGVEFREAW